jgi:hypothetical protein
LMLTSVQDRKMIARWILFNGFSEGMVVDGAREGVSKMSVVIKAVGRVIYRLGGRGSSSRKDGVDVEYWLERFDFDAMVRTRFNADLYRRWLRKN